MDEQTALVKAWKESLASKAHFDDTTLKIREFLVTLLAALIGASEIIGGESKTGLYFAVFLVWGAFYFMDRWWYHYLLLGAVLHARSLEARAAVIGLMLPRVELPEVKGEKMWDDNTKSLNSILGLTYRISSLNQESMWFGMKAKYKLDAFYFAILIALIAFVAFSKGCADLTT